MVALLVGITNLFSQTNYKCTFSASTSGESVETDSIQVKNLNSGKIKMLYKPDNVIISQKNARQETTITNVSNSTFLQQMANNVVVVNMVKTSKLNFSLYSTNGSLVTRYTNIVNAGQASFQIGAPAGVYVLVASADKQTASIKISLVSNSPLGISEIPTNKSEVVLKSNDDIITFDEGDEFEFTGYYFTQTDVKTAVITGDRKISFSFTKVTPTVTTNNVTNISSSTATVEGEVTDENGSEVIERGICWATSMNPTIADNKISDGAGIGIFSVLLSSLSEETTCFVRAFAINSYGISYGKVIKFTTAGKPTVYTTNWLANVSYGELLGFKGCVNNDNGAEVTERGFCWATISEPTIEDNKVMCGDGSGWFEVSLSQLSLSGGTKCYIRAYAINSVGIAYGNEYELGLEASTSYDDYRQTVFISVFEENQAWNLVTEVGLCWATTPNPTEGDNKEIFCNSDCLGGWAGSYELSSLPLSENTTYYVRAYAIHSVVGTVYGDEFMITTQDANAIEGTMDGEFSVSYNKKIYFSKGNLQYQASTGTWRFAENQFDMIGSDNVNFSSTYSGWIDLFDWGTSGYKGKNPYSYEGGYDFIDGSSDIAETNYDWGVYNAIINGGNQADVWRTLTYEEWDFLLNYRPNAWSKNGIATVNDVKGLILLPDEWTQPSGVTFVSGANGDYLQNQYSSSEWDTMEENGAVFLPAAGYCYYNNTDKNNVYSNSYPFGDYWSSSTYDNVNAIDLYLYHTIRLSHLGKDYGLSVRLVRDVVNNNMSVKF